MRYWKAEKDGYILSIGTGGSGAGAITAEEYETILAAIKSKPTPPDGKDYKLKSDLTWEEYDAPVIVKSSEISDAEALAIILGEA